MAKLVVRHPARPRELPHGLKEREASGAVIHIIKKFRHPPAVDVAWGSAFMTRGTISRRC